VWPFFLIVVLLLTVATTDAVDWALSSTNPGLVAFFHQQVLAPPLNLVDIVQTFVFQGTFLLGLVVATMLLAFPFAELIASLRMAYQPADEAFATSRSQYFLRSVAAFRVARANWLYGGAMIGSLTAITILSEGAGRPLAEKMLYISLPSFAGFAGYVVMRRYVARYLTHAPAVKRMLASEIASARRQQTEANLQQLDTAPWRWRLLQLPVPLVCLLIYLVWTGSGIHQEAIRDLIVPVTTKDWLLILPYALCVPVLLLRDHIQRWWLRRRLTRAVQRASRTQTAAEG
jgi:hypothetical protein